MSKYILLEKKVNGWWIHRDTKTNRIKSFRKIKEKNRSTYIWCPNCGWELTNNSHAGTQYFAKTGLEGESYICTRCKRESIFNFTIAPVALLMTKDGKISK